MRILFLLFLFIPIAEIMVLIEVGSQIGTLNTALLVVATAVLGSLMLRQQGLSTLFRAREKIDSGTLPLQEMLEGIGLAVGGALLVTPGFITDCVGFLCLLPFSRRWLVALVAKKVMASAHFSMRPGQQQRGAHDFRVFEGEYKKEEHSGRINDDSK